MWPICERGLSAGVQQAFGFETAAWPLSYNVKFLSVFLVLHQNIPTIPVLKQLMFVLASFVSHSLPPVGIFKAVMFI